MKAFKYYQHDAWGRRIVRDYPDMPRAMQILFIVNHYVYKSSIYISSLFLLATALSIYYVVEGTWLVGGHEFISDSYALAPAAIFMVCGMLALWVIPWVTWVGFSWWYYSARQQFKNSESN